MQWMPRVLGMVAFAAIAGCSKDAFKPTEETVPGPYTTTSFLVTDNGQTVDWYARGARITIMLNLDGTTSGHLFGPGAAEDGGDENQDLVGTWSFSAGRVHFSLAADTFIDDMEWSQPDFNRLSGDHTFSDGTRIRVVLGRFVS